MLRQTSVLNIHKALQWLVLEI